MMKNNKQQKKNIIFLLNKIVKIELMMKKYKNNGKIE